MRMLIDSVAQDDSAGRALPGGVGKGRCFTVAVTIVSTLTTLGSTGTLLSATGSAAFQVTLGPGSIQDAEFAYASRPEGIDAPMTWSNVSMTGGPCTSAVKVGKPSSWNFWVGITPGTGAKAGLVASYNELDQHDIVVTCENKSSRQKASVFGPAWTVAHGDGDDGESGAAKSSADAMQMMGGMSGMMAKAKEAEKLQKQVEKGEISMEEAGRMMQAMMGGGAAAAAEQASDNFMITMDGDPSPGRAVFARHTIDRSVPMPGGQGTIREHTVIEIIHVAPKS
jgi:hypothetical protein